MVSRIAHTTIDTRNAYELSLFWAHVLGWVELLGLGATLFEDHRRPDGSGWATLADPEGNEFCVLRTRHPAALRRRRGRRRGTGAPARTRRAHQRAVAAAVPR
jgi:hypothetical protein